VLGDDFSAHELLISRKIKQGTDDLSTGPAMTENDCQKAVELGIELASKAYDQGYKTLCTGEMGIGNTTSSTALFCALLRLDPAEISGAGTGLNSKGIEHKIRIVRQALSTNKEFTESNDVMKIMTALGGLEIACLTGIILGG
ncbi:MAG: nicotinate-nucleotide--dimethylbenzimidazole phosphoribosyltransferase, partial [Desulfonatronovibrio sp.]